jgi:hypothetical protein
MPNLSYTCIRSSETDDIEARWPIAENVFQRGPYKITTARRKNDLVPCLCAPIIACDIHMPQGGQLMQPVAHKPVVAYLVGHFGKHTSPHAFQLLMIVFFRVYSVERSK